ncbi:type II secretion system F family protein [candidate division NPL-UPA2 bacterium]|nr:type II secretion system F family protein [candidate division NPL-UPA2 bacterium]
MAKKSKEVKSIPKEFQKLSPETLALISKKGWEKRLKIKSAELMIFTRQFATMIDAGVPLDQALHVLSDATRNEKLKLLCLESQRCVKGGKTLSEAMGKFTRVFTEMYINMLLVAEITGDLPGILLELAEHMESDIRMKSKIKGAMTYPIMSFSMVLSIAGGLVIFIVPRFEHIFEMLGGELPLPTRIVVAISAFIRGNTLETFLIIAAICFIYSRVKKTKKGRLILDIIKIKFPVIGGLVRQILVGRFSKGLGTLLRCGVPILKSLEIVKKNAGNCLLESAIGESMVAVRGGSPLSSAFKKNSFMPIMVTKMIDIGEKTGQLDSLLEKVAKFYDERVNAALDGLTALIEPMLIGVMGVVVGGIVFAIFLPIIQIAALAGR